MITVVIIGLLVALAIPVFQRIHQEARINAFINDMRIIYYGVESFALQSGDYPDATSGALPPELEGYIRGAFFASETPLGGSWSILHDPADTIVSAVGAVGVDPELIDEVDERIDDGDASSGQIRQISGGLFWIVREESN
ncbi:MAG: type IV pilin protein [Opitutales bacterium]